MEHKVWHTRGTHECAKEKDPAKRYVLRSLFTIAEDTGIPKIPSVLNLECNLKHCQKTGCNSRRLRTAFSLSEQLSALSEPGFPQFQHAVDVSFRWTIRCVCVIKRGVLFPTCTDDATSCPQFVPNPSGRGYPRRESRRVVGPATRLGLSS